MATPTTNTTNVVEMPASRDASRDADADVLTIPISGVRAGDYLARVQVDGADSPLQVDSDPDSPTFNQFIGPLVTIP